MIFWCAAREEMNIGHSMQKVNAWSRKSSYASKTYAKEAIWFYFLIQMW